MIGEILGHYRILEQIGAGGMGVVYRAHDDRLNRDVAVKLLPAGTLADEDARRRLRQEALALSQLNHPNIATIHDFDTQQGRDFLVMELIPGITLTEKVASGALPEREVVRLAMQLAEGLGAAHGAGVLHRDLKPSNLRITPDGRLKIVDFGLAKSLPAVVSGSAAATETIEAGRFVGTVPYMAPEQLRGDPPDARSDIYSAGTVLYEMSTGKRPFPSTQWARLIDAIVRQAPALPSSLNRRVSTGLEGIIVKCLDKLPERRYQSARELRVDLERLASPSLGIAPPAPRARSRRSGKAINSLAILPFEYADPSLEYLSDGITESIIYSLSRLPNFRVIARSAVFRYKGREVDPQTVGLQLQVGAVLTGKIAQRGESMVIGAELVEVANGWQLWGEQFKRGAADLLALQDEIASQISEKLRLRLTGEEKKRLTKRYTENTEAYQDYLRGRYHWNKRTAEGFRRAIYHFEQAIEKDPVYTLAYTGMADSYLLLGMYNYLSPRESFPKGKAAALKALEIDDSLTEAHASQIFVKGFFEWDWPATEKEFRRAVELNPGYATAHQWYALSALVALGRYDEAIAEMKRAQELDPLSLSINATLGWAYYFARRYDEAIDVCGRVLEMDPDFFWGRWTMGLAYQRKGEFDKAIGEFQRARVHSRNPLPVYSLGQAHALAGRQDQALEVVRELQELAKTMYVPAYGFATIYACLGQTDEALVWLERAYEERYPFMIHLKAEPAFDALRSDPRFRGILRRVGLPL